MQPKNGVKIMKKLIFLALLTACGTGEMSDEQKEHALVNTESNEEIPDLSRWQIMNGASDICVTVSADSMSCTTEFEAGPKNCSDATFKFIAKQNGYMHILTVDHVFIRQGEPMKIEFEGKPDTFNITNNFSYEKYHAFECHGPDGEVVRI